MAKAAFLRAARPLREAQIEATRDAAGDGRKRFESLRGDLNEIFEDC